MTVIPALFVVLSSVPANGPRTTRSDLSTCPLRGRREYLVILEWRGVPELEIKSDLMITPVTRSLLPCFKVGMRTGLFCTRERSRHWNWAPLILGWDEVRDTILMSVDKVTLGGKSRNKVICCLDRGCLSHNWHCWFLMTWSYRLVRRSKWRSWLRITSIWWSCLNKVVIMMTALILAVFRGGRVLNVCHRL